MGADMLDPVADGEDQNLTRAERTVLKNSMEGEAKMTDHDLNSFQSQS